MKITAHPADWRIEIRLKDDCEEATYVYDLMQSGRLIVAKSDTLPLPFRGQFLFKIPEFPRPLEIQIGRFEAGADELISREFALKLVISTPRGQKEVLTGLESALRDVPPASEEEFKTHSADAKDEFTRIRKLNNAQKVIYAMRADQTGRRILMQQPNPLLMLYLCKNPLITLLEIIQIAKLPSIDSLVADNIARLLRTNPKWGLSEELKMALCTNPKTPGGTALSLLKGLGHRNLSRICKSGELSGTLKQAAIRLMTERKS